ncbi:CBU_1685 family Dot/Icm T4SS effector [Coxiella burnetii]|uniref:CBU_1685 family Dot/Icm T4SS effector n=1 Tax=Coxiella burnetii TaxID=777 RepID=UPI000CDEEDB2|nr:CBU_1685 family Dot/Icm T4SS effector [Coxiella burnetii]POZ75666.1 hypothetical protein CbuRSA461_09010 [Coxiella burnetii]
MRTTISTVTDNPMIHLAKLGHELIKLDPDLISENSWSESNLLKQLESLVILDNINKKKQIIEDLFKKLKENPNPSDSEKLISQLTLLHSFEIGVLKHLIEEQEKLESLQKSPKDRIKEIIRLIGLKILLYNADKYLEEKKNIVGGKISRASFKTLEKFDLLHIAEDLLAEKKEYFSLWNENDPSQGLKKLLDRLIESADSYKAVAEENKKANSNASDKSDFMELLAKEIDIPPSKTLKALDELKKRARNLYQFIYQNTHIYTHYHNVPPCVFNFDQEISKFQQNYIKENILNLLEQHIRDLEASGLSLDLRIDLETIIKITKKFTDKLIERDNFYEKITELRLVEFFSDFSKMIKTFIDKKNSSLDKEEALAAFEEKWSQQFPSFNLNDDDSETNNDTVGRDNLDKKYISKLIEIFSNLIRNIKHLTSTAKKNSLANNSSADRLNFCLFKVVKNCHRSVNHHTDYSISSIKIK